MNYSNPTPLRVGAVGTFDGLRLRVAGRVVMGMEIEGETYYWNEFNLLDGFGRGATLVYEEGDDGPEWKLFKWYEPLRALTAADGASKRVGDTVNLDGTARRITLVDQSRVCHIDGVAPEGVEVGDVADYFNVDLGDRMLVASWTRDEIEFYEGIDVSAQQVSAAFGYSGATLPIAPRLAPTASFHRHGAEPPKQPSPYLWIAGGLLCVAVIFGAYSCVSSQNKVRRSTVAPAAAPRVAPPVQLMKGARGAFAGKNYTVSSQAEVEFARVSGRQRVREYHLSGDDGASAVLLHGLNVNGQNMMLLHPATTPPGLDPYSAAARRRNAPLSVDGRNVFVRDMFQAQPVNAATGGVRYGFLASEGARWVVARWNQTEIQVYHAAPLSEADLLAALRK